MSATEHSAPKDAIADAAPSNWVDRRAPAALRPYLRLARADRPIGTWLLLWPCLWSMALAQISLGERAPNLWFLILFVVGATAMRGAGCVYNDIIDRDIDAKVARTANRPIASGAASVWSGWAFLVALSLIGLLVLLQFNQRTILLGLVSLGIVAAYPFMKRVTYWPQAWLGLTFNWGALMAWTAVTGDLAAPALLLYVGGVFWTLGYDTIYAHQDKEDDALIGVKSTALKLGADTPPWLIGFYGIATACFALAGVAADAPSIYFAAVALGGAHLAWQAVGLDIYDPADCLRRFRSNRDFGAILFVGLVLASWASVS
ncbi:MAG: 4-hydroxybenzoate octaprenyltransferase [Pseudomonadota bacterium]